MLPLKRTPPPAKSGSESNLEDIGDINFNIKDIDTEPKFSAFTSRLKRKRDFDSGEFVDEIKSLFADLVKQQNSKLTSLQATMNEIKSQNDSITASMQMLSDKYDDMQKELGSIKQERLEHLAYIKVLENRLENVERGSCASRVEIRNVPRALQETKNDLTKIVKDIGNVLAIKIEHSEIKDVFRGYAKPDAAKPILVEFTTVPKKEDFIKSVKKYNKEHDMKLNTSLLHLEGPSKPIFISESLTSKGKRLYFLARDFAKTNNYMFCWPSYGKVYLRKKEGSPQIRIDEEADLVKLRDSSV